MVRRLRRLGDAPPAPKTGAAPGPAKTEKFKKKKAKTDSVKLQAAAAEPVAVAEASASAPGPKPVDVSSKKETMKGGEQDRKTSWKEMMKGREEERMNREEKRKMTGKEKDDAEMMNWEEKRRTAGKEKDDAKRMSWEEKRRTMGKEKDDAERMNREEKRRRTGKEKDNAKRTGSGFIFMCSAKTKPECYRNGVFGLPKGKMDVVEKIQPGAKLFLYDFDLKLMYGVYKATTKGGIDLVRHTFDGKFPAQVKFSVDIDCLPIPESSFKYAIKENYSSKGRFTQELSSKQVHRLLELFKPIGLSQPAPQHIEEIRHPNIVGHRREPYDYDERQPSQYIEERGAPINVHASPPGDNYNITHSLHHQLPTNDPRHSLMLDPHKLPIGLESRQAPVSMGYHHVSRMLEVQHVPPMYRHQVDPNSSYHQPHMGTMYERTEAEPSVRDPLLAREYGALPGELAARTERLDELYRSYKRSTCTTDQVPSYGTTSYESPRSIYGDSRQRPVSTRVSGPSVPVSTRYSFTGPPAYR